EQFVRPLEAVEDGKPAGDGPRQRLLLVEDGEGDGQSLGGFVGHVRVWMRRKTSGRRAGFPFTWSLRAITSHGPATCCRASSRNSVRVTTKWAPPVRRRASSSAHSTSVWTGRPRWAAGRWD